VYFRYLFPILPLYPVEGMIDTMQPQLTCPECGRALPPDAAQGLCPSCVFELGAAALHADNPTRTAVPLTMPNPRFGDYELIEEIARGGMGVVYKARQLSLERIVAVKMILFGSMASAEQIRRFRIEASAAGSLQHPNIVGVHEVGLHEGQHFLVMDYVDGPNLSRLVQDHPLPAKQAATYLKAIAEAVQYAHQRGILHRDLKPSNVLVGSDDRPRVTDFGLAKRFDSESSLTLSGHVLGSPNYLPPEQAGGGRTKVGRASDVYSLGAILYHLLTARPPFRAETISETLQQVQTSEPLSPRLLNPSVPRDLETICLKCLEKEPPRRYQTAQAVAEELDRFLNNEPIHARPVTRAERTWRWCRRKPALAASIVLVLILILLLGVGGPLAAYRINQTRLLAENNRRLAEQNLYASDMRLASEAVHRGAFNHAKELLEKHVPKRGEEDQRGFEWRYLAHAVEESEPVRTLDGLPAPSGWSSTRLFRSERFLYNQSESADQLKAWDMTTWKPVPIVRPAQPTAVHWQWDPARESAYAVDQAQHTVTMYRLPKFEPGPTLHVPGPISVVAMSQDRQALAVGFQDDASHRVLVWDLARKVRTDMLGSCVDTISSLVFSRDGSLLAATSTNGVVGIWDLKTREPLPTPARSAVYQFEFTPDNKRLLFDTNPALSVWDVGQGQPLPFEHSGQGLGGFSFSPDASYLVVGWNDGDLTLLDSRTLVIKGSMRGHQSAVTRIAFSPDGKLMASACVDQTARIWDLATQKEVGIAGGFGDAICDVEFSADGQNVVLIGGLGQIRVYRLSALLQRGLFAKISTELGFSRLALSPDERLIATISVAGTLALWDRQSRTLIRSNSFPRYTDKSYPNLAFSPDGERLAWVTGDALRIMVVKSGEISATHIDGNREVNSVAFAPDGPELAFGCGKELRIYEVLSQSQQPFATTDDEVWTVTYSPDGALIAFGDRRGTVTLCERATGKVLSKEIKTHAPLVHDVEMSPDGRLLASCGADSLIKLWRIQPNGLRLQATLRGHMGYVNHLAFSPDGTRLVSTSGDQTLKIWDTRRAAEMATLYGHHGMLNSAKFTKDGRTIYSSGFDGEIHFWEAPPHAEIDLSTKTARVQTKPARSNELK
jgi:eukaryotic-like serine/threonine-protein kinase